MSYQIEYDTSLAPPRGADIIAFMSDFYRTSDTEELHEKYVQSFTDDATLIMGSKEAKGTDGMFSVLEISLGEQNDLSIFIHVLRDLRRWSIQVKTNHSPGIRTLRHGLWTHVASRKHTPTRIFFSGNNEIMLYGGVNYRLKANPENDVYVPWAGRVVFNLDGDVKMQFYQVYLVCTPLKNKWITLLTGVGSIRTIWQEISGRLSQEILRQVTLHFHYGLLM